MTLIAKDRQAGRAIAEQGALDRLVERLASQFPELSAEEIVRSVNGEYEGYADSRVRDFVPILVERSVRAQLTPRNRA